MTARTRGLAPRLRAAARPTCVSELRPPPLLTPPFPCHRRHWKESNVPLSRNDVTTTTTGPRAMTAFRPAGLTMSHVVEDVDAMDAVDLEPTVATQRLLRLMRTGAIDETIARELGVSLRTVHRRITRLQNLLGARSRFQLGVIACERGWVQPPPR